MLVLSNIQVHGIQDSDHGIAYIFHIPSLKYCVKDVLCTGLDAVILSTDGNILFKTIPFCGGLLPGGEILYLIQMCWPTAVF